MTQVEVLNRQRERFAKVPHRLIDDGSADKWAVLLYTALVRIANLRTKVGQTTTAEIMTASRIAQRRHFNDARAWLVQHGYVKFTEDAGKGHRYEVFDGPDDDSTAEDCVQGSGGVPPAQGVHPTPEDSVQGSPDDSVQGDADPTFTSTRELDEKRERDLRLAVASRLANLLADLIVANGATNRPNVTDTWIIDIERMIRIDSITPERVERAIRWSQKDAFWRANILSPNALRRNFERLRLAAGREPEKRPSALSAVRRAAQRAQGKK